VGEVTGFTPGPWDLVTNKFGEHVVAAGDDDIFLLDDTESSVSDHDEYTANARLTAAAPDLYGQLESGQTDLDLLRRAIEENDPKAELLIRVTDLWKRNDAALAKARGEA
jgi:hypothetical protein